ncbi:MAG: hypothetical protein LBS32_08255, partial [Clostridiales Family XIII bacterium]|nr:hypothetical protein [Clostridiales Family XIII bacterium]
MVARRRSKKSPLKRALKAVVIALIAAVCVAVGLYIYVERAALPVDVADSAAVEVFIPQGSSTPDIAG